MYIYAYILRSIILERLEFHAMIPSCVARYNLADLHARDNLGT